MGKLQYHLSDAVKLCSLSGNFDTDIDIGLPLINQSVHDKSNYFL